MRLSRAALDSLSIIAYKQPVTRAEVEEIRGVDGGAVLKGLLDRRLIRIAGQREVPGRPMLYATTRRFLEVFGLESLKALPNLRELKDLADQRGVSMPGADAADEVVEDPESDAPPSAGAENRQPEIVGDAEEAPAEESRLAVEDDATLDDWEPPEIVEPDSER